MPGAGWALAALLAAPAQERVVHVTAKRFEFSPRVIELKVGEPVVLELVSLDRRHGFAVPLLRIDEVIEPGKTLRVRVVPDHAGTWDFHCSLFCGSGHEDMERRFVVAP
jgi:cytochrome c oxidase subunit 2